MTVRGFLLAAALCSLPGAALAQELAPSPSGTDGGAPASATATSPDASYKLSGDKALRPSRITDDGTHMYLEWSEDQDLPAVFSVTTLGEGMVEGYMRGGIFIIDRVYSELIFRIDKKWARARRVVRR